MNIIKTWADACKVTGRNPKTLPDVSGLPKVDQEHIIAYFQMTAITEALNFNSRKKKAWQPDWSNYSEEKHYPWFFFGGNNPEGFSYHGAAYDWTDSSVGSRLCFKSRAIAEYAAIQFLEYYRKFMVIKK